MLTRKRILEVVRGKGQDRAMRAAAQSVLFVVVALLAGCSSDDEPSNWTHPRVDADVSEAGDAKDFVDSEAWDGTGVDGDEGVIEQARCPEDMVHIESVCVDRFEAPNRKGKLPLVMFHFNEAASWCRFRGKRLCFDDEWTRACGGPEDRAYPYGDTHEPGVCNDNNAWLTYDQQLLNAWPWSMETDSIETLEQLLDTVRAMGVGAAASADHVAWLYQASASGTKQGCTAHEGAWDLAGNVEEWTRRRGGGSEGFHGNLKGRYWAEARTCQQSIVSHGDLFRFYEIGFRCCQDLQMQ